MKKIIFALILLLSTASFAAVHERRAMSNNNQPLIQFYNGTSYYVSCYYRSQYGFYTFTLAPRQYSRWYLFTSMYQWNCRA